MKGGIISSPIALAYEVIVSMTIFNIFAGIRYLPSFLGVWILDIAPTLDNMVCKGIDYNGVAMKVCTHANKEAIF
jgi:hypothetical protein